MDYLHSKIMRIFVTKISLKALQLKDYTIMKKIKIEILCDEFYVADSLHELASNIECGDLLDQMKDEELEVNGERWTIDQPAPHGTGVLQLGMVRYLV